MTTSLNTLDINVNNIDFDNGIRATLVIDNQTINISIPKDEVDKLIGESNSSMTSVDKPTVVVDKIIGDSNADMTGVDKPTNEEIQEQRVPEEIQEQSVPEGTQEESNENNQKLSAIFENIIANEVLKYIENNSTQIDKDNLKDDIEKLKLNDSSLTSENEVSPALGHGFRCGFLGLLHMEIIKERLDREFDLDVIMTSPQVTYQVILA